MIRDPSSGALVGARRSRAGQGMGFAVEFFDPASLELLVAVEAAGGTLHDLGDVFAVSGLGETAVVQIGRFRERRFECTVRADGAGTRVEGDPSLLAALPSRLAVDTGAVLELGERGHRLRMYDLEAHLGDAADGEYPPTWEVAPDGRHAVLSRMKGSWDWPVIDLDEDRVVNRIQPPGHHEPRLAWASSSGPIAVAVFDQIHVLSGLWGQLDEGVRLKADDSGSHVHQLRALADGTVLVSWFGLNSPLGKRARALKEMAGSGAGDVYAAIMADTFGVVLRYDPGSRRIVAAARFPGWVRDPVIVDDAVAAREWSGGGLRRAPLATIDWPTHPAREPGERTWF